MNNKEIGAKISTLRDRLSMTTTELAKRVGISQAQISRLENGKQGFRSNTLARISEALGVKPIYFFIGNNAGEGATAETEPIYGLAAGGKLLDALKAPDFVQLAEKIASAYSQDPRAFTAIQLAVKAILRDDEADA